MQTETNSQRSDSKHLLTESLTGTVDWVKAGRELPERFSDSPVHLIPSERLPRAESLLKLFPQAERIFAVDFYVDGAESGPLLKDGAGHAVGEKIINIDHHAPHPRWERHVSSGNLACRWVEANGPARPGKDVIVINHTDCDSILAALIVAGALPPAPRLEEAVLDADHRGAPNPVSDLLQALSSSRNLPGAVHALSRELQGLPVGAEAAAALEELQAKRLLAADLVRTSTTMRNGVAFVRCATYIDSDLFVSQLPDSVAIVISCMSQRYPEMEITRLRLGNAAPEGLSLHRLGVAELDPYFGGRFNAGSNKRGLERARANHEIPQVIPAEAHFHSLLRHLSDHGAN